jgi:hypothetical protein
VSDSPGTVAHDTPVRVAGQFVSPDRATGTVSFEGSDGEDTGCHASASFTASIVPLNLHFAGRAANGARVTFDRSIEPHPQVLNFSVGRVRARCASGGSEFKTLDRAFGGRIRSGRFAADGEDRTSEAARVSGRFTSSTRAQGTAGKTGRDDCGFSGLAWTAGVGGGGVTPP